MEENVTKEEKIDLNKTFINQTKKETVVKDDEKKNKNLVIAITVLVLILLGVFIYFLFKKGKKKRGFEEFLEETK